MVAQINRYDSRNFWQLGVVRWTEVVHRHTVDENPLDRGSGRTGPLAVGSVAPAAAAKAAQPRAVTIYRWSSDDIVGERQTSVVGQPHFCCRDGQRLALELAVAWRALDLWTEAELTAMCNGLAAAGSSAVASAGIATTALGLGGAVAGAKAAWVTSAGMVGLAKAVVGGACIGGAKGALKGMFWSGTPYVGAGIGVAVGVGCGWAQFRALYRLHDLDAALAFSILLFSRLVRGNICYQEAYRESTAILDRAHMYLPVDAEARHPEGALACLRAIRELRGVIAQGMIADGPARLGAA